MLFSGLLVGINLEKLFVFISNVLKYVRKVSRSCIKSFISSHLIDLETAVQGIYGPAPRVRDCCGIAPRTSESILSGATIGLPD